MFSFKSTFLGKDKWLDQERTIIQDFRSERNRLSETVLLCLISFVFLKTER